MQTDWTLGVAPASPHEIATLDGFESDKDDALHCTHEETEKGEVPEGREDKKGAVKQTPLESESAELG